MIKYFSQNPEEQFSGFLKYIWNHKNSVYYSFINVSASGYYISNTGFSYYPQNAIDWSSPHHWHQPSDSSYIQFCFPQHAVLLRGYDISDCKTGCRIKNWRMIASNSTYSFPLNDSLGNYLESNDSISYNGIFKIEFAPKDAFRCFRIEQIGKSYCSAGFDVNKIDFYGYFYPLEATKNIYCPKPFESLRLPIHFLIITFS